MDTTGSDRTLPALLESLFWEYDFATLSWDTDRDLVIGRVLSAGDWTAIRWLVEGLGRRELRLWIEQHQGRGLEPRQLRFWEVVLGLRHRDVNAWLAAGDPAWQNRLVG